MGGSPVDQQRQTALAVTVIVAVEVDDNRRHKQGQYVGTHKSEPDPLNAKQQRQDNDRQIGEDDLLHDGNKGRGSEIPQSGERHSRCHIVAEEREAKRRDP